MSTRTPMYRVWTFCLSLLMAPAVQALDEPTLQFNVSDEAVETLDLTRLRSRIKEHDIELYDPHYGKTKHFRALAMTDVMDAGFGARWRGGDYTEIVFKALDGYLAVSALDKLTEPGGYLAFADLDVETGWENMDAKHTNPSPLYIVWLGKEQTTANAYPWPWQLTAISIQRFQDRYPAVYPTGVPNDSPVMCGYRLFKDRCVRCHAMDGQGGTIGPDLNAPMSVVEYRSPMMIREFIRHPSRYRHTYMPDHEDLSDQDLDDLLDYFRHQARADQSPE